MYVKFEEAVERGWKSKSAWQRAGYRVKNQRPVATAYRETSYSRGLAFRNQDYISTDGNGNYLLPVPDEYVDGRFVCNSWGVYSPDQVISKKNQPRRRPQTEVGLYQPEGRQLPSSISEKDAPFAHWLLSHLYYHPLMKFRNDRWEHFVPCGSKFLETMMGRNYKSIVRKLVNAGEIECDGSYWPGDQQIMGKCLGYRLAEHLRPAQNKWRWVPVPSNTLHKRTVRWKERAEQKLSPRQQLMLADLRELTINGNAARALIPAIVQSRILDWTKRVKAGKIQKSMSQLQNEFTQQLSRQIEAMERGDWYLKPDSYGREHSNITNLTSELRQFISFHGEPLENVDTANSQPVFLGLSLKNVIKQEARQVATDTPYCSAFCAEEKEVDPVGQVATDTPYCSAFCAEDDPVVLEVDKYLEWCEEGIYDKLALKTKQPRSKVKKEMFAGVLFNKENNWHNKTAVAFEEEFPNIRQQLRDMKAHGYQKVAHAMQRTEAAFMFNRVVPRLLQENPQMPIFTLHDSILTTPHYSQYVQRVMLDEFEKLDIKVKVRIESCVHNVAA